MEIFNKWNKLYKSQNLHAFNNDTLGLLWLKIRAICRGKTLSSFINKNNITLNTKTISEKNIELFEILRKNPEGMTILDNYLKEKNNEWYTAKGVDEEKLKNDLYKVQYYVWGGDRNNSLDKHFVSRYIKTISDYDTLISKQTEIAENAWNYVQTSWYNNWTSFLIESIFKRHKNVISAIGEIKSVDFFLNNFPIDLKVTYFPSKYMEIKLKEKLGKSELTWVKLQAKKIGITTDNNDSPASQLYALTEQLSEIDDHSEIIEILNDKHKQVIQESQANPTELMTWLYENQGEMRFGAENRLFLILVDTANMRESWKLKRAFRLIEPTVTNYLNKFNKNSLKEISFNFKGTNYKSFSDIIFVMK